VILQQEHILHGSRFYDALLYGGYLSNARLAQVSHVHIRPLQLLVLQLALQLLRLCHLPHSLVEIVLTNILAVVLNGEQAPRNWVSDDAASDQKI
jgi:hypothetical protein